jgi:hypothetical protein
LQERQGNGNGAATPDDYLEKIFQIPFWLRPMGEGSCLQMVQGLLAPSLAVDDEEEAADPGVDMGEVLSLPAPEADTEDLAEVPDLEEAAEEEHSSEEDSSEELAAAAVEAERIDLAPGSLVIHRAEKEFIESLAPVLGRSPRALKRFVNIYQLIKAGLSEEERASFLEEKPGERPDYQAVLVLLAAVTGAPDIAPTFSQALRQAERENLDLRRRNPPGGEFRGLRWLVDAIGTKVRNESSWIKVRALLWPRELVFPNQGLTPLIKWEPEVSRYSFRVPPEEEPFVVPDPDETDGVAG